MSGHLPEFLRGLTVPASWLYRAAIHRRNARFDAGRGVHRLDVPVISVGNLTTGGTGKTPMVAWIARQLLDAGFHPAIALRGYHADRDGRSDEAMEYAEQLPDVPLVVHPDRVAALKDFLPRHRDVNVVLLDDGFQHRRLARDLDLVLIDASRRTERDELLPAGTLREPPTALARADAVMLTHAEEVSPALEAWIEQHHGRPALVRATHQWTGLTRHDAAGAHPLPLDWLRGRRIATLFGVGHPGAVEQQARAFDPEILIAFSARDHERYDRTRLLSMRPMLDAAEALLTTRKDWVKLQQLIDWTMFPVPVVVPELALSFQAGEALLRERLLAVVGDSRNRTP